MGKNNLQDKNHQLYVVSRNCLLWDHDIFIHNERVNISRKLPVYGK